VKDWPIFLNRSIFLTPEVGLTVETHLIEVF
jgi:hypothetical protein